jgi:hypothetical protein
MPTRGVKARSGVGMLEKSAWMSGCCSWDARWTRMNIQKFGSDALTRP